MPLSTSQRIVTVEVGTGDERRWLVLGVTLGDHDAAHDGAARARSPRRMHPAADPRRSPRRGAGARERTPAEPPRRAALARRSRSPALASRASRRRPTQTRDGRPTLPLLIGQSAGSTSYSVPVQTLLFFTALSFLPAVLLLMTSFTRIVIVLSLLRQALGTQAAPPNQVVIGLSLFLTFFVMGPTIDKVYADAYQPYAASQIAFEEALKRGESPVRDFMMKQTRQADVMLFAKLAKHRPVGEDRRRAVQGARARPSSRAS